MLGGRYKWGNFVSGWIDGSSLQQLLRLFWLHLGKVVFSSLLSLTVTGFSTKFMKSWKHLGDGYSMNTIFFLLKFYSWLDFNTRERKLRKRYFTGHFPGKGERGGL